MASDSKNVVVKSFLDSEYKDLVFMDYNHNYHNYSVTSPYCWGEKTLIKPPDWEKHKDRINIKHLMDVIEKATAEVFNQSIFDYPKPEKGLWNLRGGKLEYDRDSIWFTPAKPTFTFTTPSPKSTAMDNAMTAMYGSPHATWHSIVDNENEGQL